MESIVKFAFLIAAIVPVIAFKTEPPAPLNPVPSPSQIRWHEWEFIAFIHFNMNTFTDYEWGFGTEDPDLFNPSDLDCRQWACICRAAGMKAVILTAKHHDGFCLWPSKFTDHSVKSSAWRAGRGDVVKDLAQACREFGLKLGIYISPWDRHEPTYGDSPKYNEYFKNQLTELLTGYGPVAEVWWDGACGEGPNGRRQVYDWQGYKELVRELQPDAVIFAPPDIVPDIRWVGNENGYADPTNWCRLHEDEIETEHVLRAELGTGHRNGAYWIPAECDVSIRPGWYYHADQDDKVKSLEHLLDIYYGSVGRGGVLLLNLPVDRRGLVHENDEARLMELKRILDLTFEDNLAEGAALTASNIRGGDSSYAPSNVLDGDRGTYWAVDDEVLSATLELRLKKTRLFNRVMLQEYIELGQRVEAFNVEVFEEGEWKNLAKGTTIGYKRILRTRPACTDRVRLNITSSLACPTLSSFGLFVTPPRVEIEPDTIGFLKEHLDVRLASDLPGAVIHYTLDGTEPTKNSPVYDGPFRLDATSTVKAAARLADKPGFGAQSKTYEKYDRDALPEPIELPDDRLRPGLEYTYYEGGWQSLRDMVKAKPLEKGFTKTFDLDMRKREEHFALEFRGYVKIPEDGIYTFHTTSDDGSMLFIDDQVVVENDYLQGMTERSGEVPLKTGLHPITVKYFNAGGAFGLKVSYEGPGIEKQAIPAMVLR